MDTSESIEKWENYYRENLEGIYQIKQAYLRVKTNPASARNESERKIWTFQLCGLQKLLQTLEPDSTFLEDVQLMENVQIENLQRDNRNYLQSKDD